jgi:2-polyprenyl-3-methyl-5-hydroxy-6-metoxy-1,4-benzoquinol methylase
MMLEVGCGVGNFIWPLLQEDESLFFYACDFSPRAVQFVKVSSRVCIENNEYLFTVLIDLIYNEILSPTF